MEDIDPLLNISLMSFQSWTRGSDFITIQGSNAGDTITGSGQNETIDGRLGNDSINGFGGLDILRGGTGDDTFHLSFSSYSSAQGFLQIDGGADQDTLRLTHGSMFAASHFDFTQGESIQSIERLVFASSAGTAVLPATISFFMHQFAGTSIVEVESSVAVEHLIFKLAPQTTSFDLGATRFKNWTDGVDTLTLDLTGGPQAGSTIIGSQVSETVLGSSQDEVVRAGDGNDQIFGAIGFDTLEGGVGDDLLDGGIGNDTMAGGNGSDTYIVDSTGDSVTETSAAAFGGFDRVEASITYTLGANLEALTLTGSTAINGTGNGLANTMIGNSESNILNGLGGNDVMSGAAGNDILNSGYGNDTVTGGAGLDAFLFNNVLNATNNVDTIQDFVAADDTIRLENAIFTALTVTGTLAATAFKANASGIATTADHRILYNQLTGALSYDANGNAAGGAMQFATLATKPNISAADFLVV